MQQEFRLKVTMQFKVSVTVLGSLFKVTMQFKVRVFIVSTSFQGYSFRFQVPI